MNNSQNFKYVFFGSSRFSVLVLDNMEKFGYLPNAIITTPDKPQGRKLILTANPVKTWGITKNINVYTPEKFDTELSEQLKNLHADVFIVASYGKIIPELVINIPPRKTLNIHPSLLPKYRGASPLQTAILDDTKNTGVTIMRIDEKMDHGPIIAQKELTINDWPNYEDFESFMAEQGTVLLVSVLQDWVNMKIPEIEQDHNEASYTKKINKEQGLINLSDDPYNNFRKIQAFNEWPKAYFEIIHNGQKIKVKITSARFENNNLFIEKVIPQGAKEISYKDFKAGYIK